MTDNPLLSFFYELNADGEVRTVNKEGRRIIPKRTAYYFNVRFTLFDTGRVLVDGSIHKYWNDGEHNYNDFDLRSIRICFNELLGLFSINPHDAWLLSIEYGLNIIPPTREQRGTKYGQYVTKNVLQNLFFHAGKPFRETHTKTEGNYYQAEHDQYRIKIYDKALQYKRVYNLRGEILRVEINYKGVKLRNYFGISTLQDLMHTPLKNFQNDLIKQFDRTLFYDFTINHKSIRLLKYSNKNYWRNLIEEGRTASLKKHKRLLNEYVRNDSQNVKGHIIEILETKFNELTQGGISIQPIHEVLNRIPI